MSNRTIVDNVVERLQKAPLGDLITEEDLHEIVKQAIPKVFFDKREFTDSRGYKSSAEPLMVEVMRELLQDSARKAVQKWLVENSEGMAEHWKAVIDAGLLTYVQVIQNEKATAQVKAALAPLMGEINNERSKVGLPWLNL